MRVEKIGCDGLKVGDAVVATRVLGETFGGAWHMHAMPGELGQVVYLDEGLTTIRWERGSAFGCLEGEFRVLERE